MTDTTVRDKIERVLEQSYGPFGEGNARRMANHIVNALPDLTAPQWQPIDTAPKDYTEIIGIDVCGRIAKTWFFAPSSYTRDWMRCGFGKQKPWTPTHWMPLPDAPTRGAL